MMDISVVLGYGLLAIGGILANVVCYFLTHPIPRFWDVGGGDVKTGGGDVREIAFPTLMRGKAVIVVASHLRMVTGADHILVLDHGVLAVKWVVLPHVQLAAASLGWPA